MRGRPGEPQERRSGSALLGVPAGRGQQPNVMAAVMSAETASQPCDLAQQRQLHLRRIDVSPCALVALACRGAAPAEDEIWGVLDLGLRHSVLTVVIGAVPAYVRVLSVAAPIGRANWPRLSRSTTAWLNSSSCEHGVGPQGCTTAPHRRAFRAGAAKERHCRPVRSRSLERHRSDYGRFDRVAQIDQGAGPGSRPLFLVRAAKLPEPGVEPTFPGRRRRGVSRPGDSAWKRRWTCPCG